MVWKPEFDRAIASWELRTRGTERTFADDLSVFDHSYDPGRVTCVFPSGGHCAPGIYSAIAIDRLFRDAQKVGIVMLPFIVDTTSVLGFPASRNGTVILSLSCPYALTVSAPSTPAIAPILQSPCLIFISPCF